MKKIIIIGATSGIGQALAEAYAAQGHTLGLTGRRMERLEAMQQQLNAPIHIARMDITELDESRTALEKLVQDMGGMDIIILNSGVATIRASYSQQVQTIDTNVRGFTALADWAFTYFREQGEGHLVGISSIAAVRGGSLAPVYHASKAFISSYMEGIRIYAKNKGLSISVTDIRPGFVKTPMTEQNDKMFWVAPVDKAAKQIIQAIRRKKKVAYITKRWGILAWIMRHAPDFLYRKMA